jgi:hypothetical protein
VENTNVAACSHRIQPIVVFLASNNLRAHDHKRGAKRISSKLPEYSCIHGKELSANQMCDVKKLELVHDQQ